MGEAKLESSHSHFTPRSMQMILHQLTSISGSASCSMIEMGCQVGAQLRHRVMYSFNFRMMTCCTEIARPATHAHTDATFLLHEQAATTLCMQMQFSVVEKHFPVMLVNFLCDNCFNIKSVCLWGVDALSLAV